MLDENAVVKKVAEFLDGKGFHVDHARHTNQRGIDIEGSVPDRSMRFGIEAKGGMRAQSTEGVEREPFGRSTIYSSVTTAYFCASTYVARNMRAGVAFPGVEAYRNQVAAILPTMKKLEIEIFWVSAQGEVTAEGHWEWP